MNMFIKFVHSCVIVMYFEMCSSEDFKILHMDRFTKSGLHRRNTDTVYSSSEDKIVFLLYTRRNPTIPETMTEIIINTSCTPSSTCTKFDTKRDTKILIHGWLNSHKSQFSQLLKTAYLTRYNVNVIVVDWSPISNLIYFKARQAVNHVAQIFSSFITLLIEQGLETSRLHIIGHSLGAHVAGVVGLSLNNTIERITGLDPAGPSFDDKDEDRLMNSSAKFVDVIHSCGKFLGYYPETGHVDFYPNKGTAIQPGCGFDLDGVCSHRRAYKYFAESIASPNSFMGLPCISWDQFERKNCSLESIKMGEFVPITARGSYYLKTSDTPPYGQGKFNF